MKNTKLNFKIMQIAYVYTRHVHFSSSIHYYNLLSIFYLLQIGVWPSWSFIYTQPPHPWYKSMVQAPDTSVFHFYK